MLSHYFHVFVCTSVWIDVHPLLESEVFAARKLMLSYACVAPGGHGIRQGMTTTKTIIRVIGAWGRPCSTELVSPPVEDPAHHDATVAFQSLILQQDSETWACFPFPYLRLSHSAVGLITSMCEGTRRHKLNLSSLNSLTRCLGTMEYDFSYLVLD